MGRYPASQRRQPKYANKKRSHQDKYKRDGEHEQEKSSVESSSNSSTNFRYFQPQAAKSKNKKNKYRSIIESWENDYGTGPGLMGYYSKNKKEVVNEIAKEVFGGRYWIVDPDGIKE